jgi:hypothetical protein
VIGFRKALLGSSRPIEEDQVDIRAYINRHMPCGGGLHIFLSMPLLE